MKRSEHRNTSVWRFGDLVVTSSFNMLRGLGTTVPGFAVLAMLAAGCSGWVGWRAAKMLPESGLANSAEDTSNTPERMG